MQEDNSLLGLSTIRRNRGIALEDISKATKISVRCLEAIEKGDFRRLPGGIYNTSYIRQYARAIDYDESLILAEYHRETGTTPPQGRDDRPADISRLRPASSIFAGR
jgi:cytoskeletal protein RodZ